MCLHPLASYCHVTDRPPYLRPRQDLKKPGLDGLYEDNLEKGQVVGLAEESLMAEGKGEW